MSSLEFAASFGHQAGSYALHQRHKNGEPTFGRRRAGPVDVAHEQAPQLEVREEAAGPGSRVLHQLARLKNQIETRCHTVDLAPDLAQDIGSGRWFRGLGTMLGLGVVAISFWPDITAVEAATAPHVDQPVRDEFRSQMIMPLALGSDSGRHMGPTALVQPLRSAPERPTLQLVATLGRGDSFARVLQRAGVGASDAARVVQLVGNVIPAGELAAGTQFDIALGKREQPDAPRPLEALAFRARFDLDLAVTREKGMLTLEHKPIAVDATPLRIRGSVGSSIYRSARSAGAPLKAVQQYLRAIDEYVSLESGIDPNDQFDIVIAYKRSAKGEREAGELLYAGLERGGKPRLQLVRWGSNGQFFEASGFGRQTSRYFQPVAGRMSSQFGVRRHPILGYRRLHAGVDYAARHGTPIMAVSDGVVTYSGRHGGHGNYVRIDHGGRLGSGYAHMSSIAVSSGTRVRAGQVIGYVGSTGLSTGPHLHFEVYQGGRAVNPTSVQFVSRPQVSDEQLAQFRARLKQLRAVPVGAALADLNRPKVQGQTPVREIDRVAAQQPAFAPGQAVAAPKLASRSDGTSRN